VVKVQRDMLKSWGLNLSPGISAYQRIILNNSYAHDEQEDDPGQEHPGQEHPGQEKEGLTMSSINCDHC